VKRARERRKLTHAHTETDVEVEGDVETCHYCKSPASDKVEYLPKGRIYPLCSEHLCSIALPNRQNWQVLKQ